MKPTALLISFYFSLLTFGCFAQWQKTSCPAGYNIHYLAVNGRNNIFAGAFGGGIYLSTDDGNSWSAADTGLTNKYIYTIAVSGSNIFAGTFGGGVFLSSDDGKSWTQVNNGLGNKSVESLAINGTGMFAGTENGVSLTTNNGESWTVVNNGIPSVSDIPSIAVCGSVVLTGSYGNGVFLSTDNGESWTASNYGLSGLYIFSFGIKGNNIFTGTYGHGIFLSADNGSSWTAMNNGLPYDDQYGYPQAFSFAAVDTNIFAGTSRGVFLSTDNGAEWKVLNTGLKDTVVSSLLINGEYIYAGTTGGVYRRALSDIVGINKLQVPGSGFRVQCYPDPVNSLLVVSYSLLEKSEVKISVYDMTGREVDKLRIRNYELGINNVHKIIFDAGDLRSGIYFIKLSTDSGIKVKKFVKE